MRAASYSLPVFRCSDVTRTTGASENLSCRNGKKKSKHSRLKASNRSNKTFKLCNTFLKSYYPLLKQQIISFFDSFWSSQIPKNCPRASAYGFSFYSCCTLAMISVIFSDADSYFAITPCDNPINNIVIKDYMETVTTKIQEQKTTKRLINSPVCELVSRLCTYIPKR